MKHHLVLGHHGMVGSAIKRALERDRTNTAYCTDVRLDSQADVNEMFMLCRDLDTVWLCAARVGGIIDNYIKPIEYIYDNLMIQANVIRAASFRGIERIVFMGSSCIYPRDAHQPIVESSLMTGPLEETNRAYAVAKIAGIELLRAYEKMTNGFTYLALMPCNLYGPGDRYDTMRSHVIPALIMKMHEAKVKGYPSVSVGGDGTPLREFMHVDDLATAAVALEAAGANGVLNVGSGEEAQIAELAYMISLIVGFKGEIEFDKEIPNGTPRKLLDSSAARAIVNYPTRLLSKGLKQTYQDYQERLKA